MVLLLVRHDLLHVLNAFLTMSTVQRLRSTCKDIHDVVTLPHQNMTLVDRADCSPASLYRFIKTYRPFRHLVVYQFGMTQKLARALADSTCDNLASMVYFGNGLSEDIRVIISACRQTLRRCAIPHASFPIPVLPLLENFTMTFHTTSQHHPHFVQTSHTPMLHTATINVVGAPIVHAHLTSLTISFMDAVSARHLCASTLPQLKTLVVKSIMPSALPVLRDSWTHTSLTYVDVTHYGGEESVRAIYDWIALFDTLITLHLTLNDIDNVFFSLVQNRPIAQHLRHFGWYHVQTHIDGNLTHVWPHLETSIFTAHVDPVPRFQAVIATRQLCLQGNWILRYMPTQQLVTSLVFEVSYVFDNDHVLYEILDVLPRFPRLETLSIAMVPPHDYDDDVVVCTIFTPPLHTMVGAFQSCVHLRHVELPILLTHEDMKTLAIHCPKITFVTQ